MSTPFTAIVNIVTQECTDFGLCCGETAVCHNAAITEGWHSKNETQKTLFGGHHAFVGFEGNYDLATHPYRPNPYDNSQDHTLLKDEDPELWKAIDPYTHIGKNPELQIRLIHGKDHDSAGFVE